MAGNTPWASTSPFKIQSRGSHSVVGLCSSSSRRWEPVRNARLRAPAGPPEWNPPPPGEPDSAKVWGALPPPSLVPVTAPQPPPGMANLPAPRAAHSCPILSLRHPSLPLCFALLCLPLGLGVRLPRLTDTLLLWPSQIPTSSLSNHQVCLNCWLLCLLLTPV